MNDLPILPFEPIETNNIMMEEDIGDYIPCTFGDEEEDETDEPVKCALCAYGDGGANGQANQIISRMQEIDSQLVGKIQDSEIYKLQAEIYRTQVAEPLQRQGIKCPEVTADCCRAHFSKHQLNMKRMIGNEIAQVNTMQRHVRSSQILSRNNVTGLTKVDNGSLKVFVTLSKHKLDLIKYYKNTLSKDSGKATANIKPYSFN
jgi:hypothetical protein|tara:strand:+ start:2430 stop:3038 length:609 start_codon:yes stop_codon:yes gene_type:complete